MSALHVPEMLLICFLAVLVGGPYMFYRRWYVPRRDRLGFEKAGARVERRHQEEHAGVAPNPIDSRYAISFDPKGFTVTDLRNQQEPVVRCWSSICLVTVFKRDLFTVDCICLHLADADGMAVELDEEMAGWNGLLDSLPTHLPGCKPRSEWYSAVASPAFAANPTQIYARNPKLSEQSERPLAQ